MGLFDIFKKEEVKTGAEALNASLPKLFREIGEASGVAPTKKLSDEQINKIFKEVATAFTQASEQKGEHIPGGYIMTIAMTFFAIYEKHGEDFYYKHINYEINKYLNEGLREGYKHNLT